jgi:hypothetical protein
MQFLDSGALRIRHLFGVASVLLIIGCGNPDVGSFHPQVPDKNVDAKDLKGPGQAARDKAAAKPLVPKKGRIQRPAGTPAPTPD